jgi:hypothetical protein
MKKLSLFFLGCGLSFIVQGQTVAPKYKTTLETQRIIVRTDEPLKTQLLQNQVAQPDALRVRQQNLLNEFEDIVEKKKRAMYIGDAISFVGDYGPVVRPMIGFVKGFIPSTLIRKRIENGLEWYDERVGYAKEVWQSLPERDQDRIFNNFGKYFTSEYHLVDAQKNYDENLWLVYTELIASATKQNPQNPNTALDAIANQLKDPYVKSKFIEFRQQSLGKTFANPNNSSLPQASQKLLKLDSSIDNWISISGDYHGETLFNEQMQYYVAQKYKSELATLQTQAATLQRDLRSANLTQQQILQKQADLKKVVTKIGVSLDGFEYATNKKLGSIEAKLEKYGSITQELLLEVKLEKTPLDQRVKMLEEMRQRAATQPTPLSIVEIDSYLERDRELQRIEEKKEIVSVAQMAIQVGNGALSLMETLQIGSAKDRQYVAYGLKIAEIGINLYAGNYFAAFSSAMSLFSKPKPSPEMRMLSKILGRLDELERTITTGFRDLHNQLVAVHQDLVNRLDFISYQITDFRMEMLRNHQQIVTSLNEIENRLDYLIIQNNRLDSKLTALLGGGQDACFEPYNTWGAIKDQSGDTTRLTPNFLNSFVEGAFCKPCFESLLTTLTEDFVNGPKRSAFDYTVEPAESAYQHLYNQKDLFRKQAEFWNNQFTPVQKDTAVSSLLYPTLQVTGHKEPFKNLSKQRAVPVLNAVNTFSNVDYMNYKRVVQMADYVCDFYSLLSIYRNGVIMDAAAANSSTGSVFIQFRTNLLEGGAKKTLNLVEKAIAHESLMMGIHLFDDFYNTLNGSRYSPDESGIGAKTLAIGRKMEEIFKILRSNPIMARNFASYAMVKAMISNTNFESNFKKYDDGIKKEVDFEGAIPLNTAQWLYMRVGNDGLALGVQKQYIKNIGGVNQMIEDHVHIPLVQDQEPILVNDVLTGIRELYVVDKMMPTEGMMALQQVREKLKALIIEINIVTEATVADQPDKLTVGDLQFITFSDFMMNKAYNDALVAKMPKKCDIEMNITNNITTGPQKIESGVVINATNKVTGGVNITYDAGGSITLKPGFEVRGTTFTALIDGCGNK